MKKILIINGPNLNLLGKREIRYYGDRDFESLLKELRESFPQMEIDYKYLSDESAIINALHTCEAEGVEGVVMNPGAYTHTSIAIGDAVASISVPVVEVHISNIYARELFRQRSYVSKYAAGIITGCGVSGYRLALHFLAG